MKKLSIFFFTFMFVTATVNAQDASTFKISIGAELSFPTGNFSNTHAFGIGGTAQVEFPVQDRLSATATGGILFYNGKSIPGSSGAKFTGQTIIPLKVGLKNYFTTGLYGAAQIGLGFFSNFASGTAFAYSPQLGYEFNSKSGKSFDISIKYDGYAKNGSIGAFGIRVAKVL